MMVGSEGKRAGGAGRESVMGELIVLGPFAHIPVMIRPTVLIAFVVLGWVRLLIYQCVADVTAGP